MSEELASLRAEAARLRTENLLLRGDLLVLSEEERDRLGMRGLIPARHRTLEQCAALVLQRLRNTTVPLERYLFLMDVHDSDPELFYHVLSRNLDEVAPFIVRGKPGTASSAPADPLFLHLQASQAHTRAHFLRGRGAASSRSTRRPWARRASRSARSTGTRAASSSTA
jgi:hypothetical protein